MASPNRSGTAALVTCFTALVFTGAALLFTVEPLIARLVLPVLGGAPAVWNTALLFFQSVLLAGYLYAHALRRLPLPAQAAIHLALLLAAAWLALPPQLPESLAVPSGGTPALWLLGLLARTIGLPFLALAATAPLAQSWFAGTRHRDAGDPYFLYAASNAGSLLALLAYPFVVEPALGLAAQGRAWTGGFALAALLVLLSAALAMRGATATQRPAHPVAQATTAPPIATRTALRWLALSALPSSLLLGVTTHITTDLASAPLLWVLPLALYLLTFIASFARRPWLPLARLERALPVVLIAAMLLPVLVPGSLWPILPGLAAFVLVSLVCHGRLAASRPPAAQLTAFYLWLALGGVLGGAFNALLAPQLFDDVLEYPLALAAAALLVLPRGADSRRARWLDVLLPLALLALLLATRRWSDGGELERARLLALLRYVPAGIALVAFSDRPYRFALALVACLGFAHLQLADRSVLLARSFFGVYRAERADAGRLLLMTHGTTVHGVAGTDPAEATTPLGYYARVGPFGQFFAAADAAGRAFPSVAVAGLGAGGLGCYARPGEHWRFDEIDPLVETLARDPRLFGFLARCGNQPEVRIGDARLSLAATAPGSLDLLIVDVFTSDSIPVHLMTREAFATYRRALAPRGLLVVHLSNRFLDLVPIVDALARESALALRVKAWQPADAEAVRRYRQAPVTLAVLAADGEDLAFLDGDAGWRRGPSAATAPAWRDDHADLLRTIRWR